MLENQSFIKNKLSELLKTEISDQLLKIIDNTFDLIEKGYKKRLEYLKKLKFVESDKINLFLDINNAQIELVKNNPAFIRTSNSQEFLGPFLNKAEQVISGLPAELILEQSKNRFYSQPEDKFLIRILKFFKLQIFHFSKTPFYLGNLFRKIFNKDLKKLRYWDHKVPYKSLVRYHLIEEMLIDSLRINSQLYSEINEAIVKFWKIDQELDFKFFEVNGCYPDEMLSLFDSQVKETKNILNRLKDFVRNEYEDLFYKQVNKLEDCVTKAGTIELYRKKYSDKKLSKIAKQKDKLFNVNLKNWSATVLLLKEDWLQDIELLVFRGELAKESEIFLKEFNNFLTNDVQFWINNFGKEIIKAAEKIKVSSNLETDIINIRNDLNKNFDEVFNLRFEELLSGEKVVNLLALMDLRLDEKLNMISEERAISNSDDYSKEISAGSVNYLSPREIVKLEVIPDFLEAVRELKSNIINKFNEMRTTLMNVQQIADFTLEASLEIEDENNIADDPQKVIEKGIGRAVQKNDYLVNGLIAFSDSIISNFHSALDRLVNALMRLTVNENIIKLKLIIVKAKTVKQAVNIKSKILSNLKSLFISVGHLSKSFIIQTKSKYSEIIRKFGITQKPKYIKSEDSDFLADTNRALENLPYIYKRLFRIEPLKDDRLFTARSEEYAELMKAYKNWLKGRFAPVVFVGEKGSGVTTLINLALKSVKNKEVYRTSISTIIFRKNDFLNFLAKLFNVEKFNSGDEVVDFLNNTGRKRIVILENIQHLYLRTVGGFESLKMLFFFISATNKNVFWVTSTTVYSWEYLKKTISISDYFGYLIKLGQLDKVQIFELIEKRHRISGFDLKFEVTEEIKKSKSFANLSDSEINELLKKEFYEKLNKFAGNNISLALLYWIRSAIDFRGNTLIMNPELEIDVSFLSDIKSEKLFILHSLILHDGIDLENLSIATGFDKETCRLTTMQLIDDGILFYNGSNFVVNPLVYRQLVTTLKDKNILH